MHSPKDSYDTMKVSRRRFIVLGGLGLTGLSLAAAPKLIRWAQVRTDQPFPLPPELKNESKQAGRTGRVFFEGK